MIDFDIGICKFASLVILLLLTGCSTELAVTPTDLAHAHNTPAVDTTPEAAPTSLPAGPFSPDEIATLDNLEQVDELPFYVMHYVGDYGFQELLAHPQVTDRREAVPDWGCTVFASLSSQGEPLLGRNFDWYPHPALLLFTDPPEGYASVSMVDVFYLDFDGEPLSEAEQRNLLDAPFLPFDGMNEMGLAVGMMAVDHAEGGNDSSKSTLDELLIIRLLLDQAADVDEALTLLDGYNVDFSGGPPLHYLIADRSGAAAVIEYIDRSPRVIRNKNPWLVATNFLVNEEKPVEAGSSCWRYNRAYTTLEMAGGQLSAAQAMDLLQEVSQDSTLWSVVYDMRKGEIQLVIRRNFNQLYDFQLLADNR